MVQRLFQLLKHVDTFLKNFRIDFGISPFWTHHLLDNLQEFDLFFFKILKLIKIKNKFIYFIKARKRLFAFWELKKKNKTFTEVERALMYDLCEEAYLEMKEELLMDQVLYCADMLSLYHRDCKNIERAGRFMHVINYFEQRQILMPFFYVFLFCFSFFLGAQEGNFWLHWEFGINTLEEAEIFWTKFFKPINFDPRPVGHFNTAEFEVGIFGFPALFFSLFILFLEFQSPYYSSKTRFVAFLLVFYTLSLVLIQGFEPRLSTEEALEQIKVLGLRNPDGDYVPLMWETVDELKAFFAIRKPEIVPFVGRELPIADPVEFYEYSLYILQNQYPFFGEQHFLAILQWGNGLIFFKCITFRRIYFPIFKKTYILYDEAEHLGYIPRWVSHATRMLSYDYEFICKQSILHYKYSIRRFLYLFLFIKVIIKISKYLYAIFLVTSEGSVPLIFWLLKLKMLAVTLFCLIILFILDLLT